MEFIYEIENALPKEMCEEMIQRYKDDNNKTDSRLAGGIIDKSIRSSKSLLITGDKKWKDMDDILFKKLNEGLKEYYNYLKKYTTEKVTNSVVSFIRDEGYWIQEMKTGDFYDWHVDFDGDTQTNIHGNRTITAIWYLNTLDEDQGGCTEFWGGKKVRPKQGTLLFFPSTWTYIHRGAPVKNSGVKYTCITWLNKKNT